MDSFETYRHYLFSIAYRMLGSAMDAEDLVQETSLRYQVTAPQTIRSLKAYLTTILTRLCLEHLQLVRQLSNSSPVSRRRSSAETWRP